MEEQRLPIVNSDDGLWGDILNQYIGKEHYNGDTDLNQATSENGGHQHVTLQPGTTSAGTAPLKFMTGPLMTAAEPGAVEFLADRLYYTQTTGATRKTIAAVDDIQHTPTATWGDNFSTLSVRAGTTCYVRVPYSGTIASWSIIADVSCTCVLDVWKANAALPTVANTITASAKPSLSSAATASSSTLTGWTTSVAVGDVFGFNLDSLTGSPTSITLVLNITNG
jgi:hypothetical protein